MWWDILIAIGAGVLLAWVTLLIALLLIRPKGALLAEAIRARRPDGCRGRHRPPRSGGGARAAVTLALGLVPGP
jgi:hypothetical protein